MTSKYDILKEQAEVDIVSERYSQTYACFLYTADGMIALDGVPLCPECSTVFNKPDNDNLWCCDKCATVWTLAELVEALRM